MTQYLLQKVRHIHIGSLISRFTSTAHMLPISTNIDNIVKRERYVQTMNISQSDEPLSKYNFAFRHRLWIIQHCSLAIIAAFMVAVLLGTLNLGPFSKASIDTNSEIPLNDDSSVRRDALTNFYYPIRSPELDNNEIHKE